MLRLITFDANNTLFKVRNSVGQIYSKVAQQYGHVFDEKNLNNEFNKAYKIYYKKYPNFGVEKNITPQCFWYKIVDKTFVNAGLKDKSVITKIADTLYQDFTLSSNWELFADVQPVLQHLKSKGYNLGVVSNFDERLPAILEGLDVLKYFSVVLCSTEIKIAKPSPDIFELALRKGGVLPEEALHIGDNVLLDYKASKAVGMSSFVLDRFMSLKQEHLGIVSDPSHVISDLNPLIKLL